MVLCKFFLEGCCRYGQRCKFKHAYYDDRDNGYYGYDDQGYNRNQHRQTNSKGYHGVSILRNDPSFTPIEKPNLNYNTGSGFQNANYNSSSDFGSTTNYNYNPNSGGSQRNSLPSQLIHELLTTIVKELETSERGHQWPLSCCCPVFRETVNIPGWVDHSPEELRWEIYKSSKDGTFEQCKLSIKQLFQEAQERRNVFKSREKAIPIIETMLEMKRISNAIFSNATTDNGFDSTSTFPSVAQPHSLPFSSGFGNAQPLPAVGPAPQLGPFHDPAPSFSFALNQNSTANNINPVPSFISTAPPPQIINNSQPIQNNQGIFNGNSPAVVSGSNSTNFSNISDLSESELNSYQAVKFNFGQIPMKPPPSELCVNFF